MSAPALRHDDDVALHRWTSRRYEELLAQGVFEGEPVELLDGVLVEVNAQGPHHTWALTLVHEALAAVLDRRYVVVGQAPLVTSALSTPEPDVAVLERRAFSRERLPRGALLVVEVARTSARTDLLHKARVYAEGRVQEYWVLDLRTEEVVVHRGPEGDGADARWAEVRRLPLDAELQVLGVRLRLSEVLADGHAAGVDVHP